MTERHSAFAAVCAALTNGDPALESMAVQLVPELPGTGTTAQLTNCLVKTPAPVQALLLGALAVRADAAARGSVQAAVSSMDPAVRLAAINALGSLGDESSIETLVDRTQAVGAMAERQAARNSLAHLRGPRLDEVLTGLLLQENTNQQAELIRILERHPHAEVCLLEHRQDSTDRPRPRGDSGHPRIPCTAEAVRQERLNCVFLATPPEVSMELAPWCLEAGAKVIDISGAFRFRKVLPFRFMKKFYARLE